MSVIRYYSLRDANYTITVFFFFFSSRRRHTRLQGDWSSDVCSSDLLPHRQRHGANDTSPEGDPRDGDREDHGGQAGPDRHRDGHGQDEVGKRLEDLHDALAHEVEPPAQVATREAPQRADGRAEEDGRERDE